MTTEKFTDAPRPKVNRVEVYWHTVTYRTILLYAFAFVILFTAAGYLVFPDTFASMATHLSHALGGNTAGR